MTYFKYLFFIVLFFTNLTYSDDNNQLLLIKDKKKIDPFYITNLKGEDKLISGTQSNVIILNFWATWCAPCIKEIPDLIELKDKFEDKIDLYFVSVDQNVNKVVPKFLKKNNFKDLDIVNDEKLKISKKFNVKVMPTTIIINKDFYQKYTVSGYVDWKSDKFLNLINDLL
jgi:thiol-disulfide isomerase/thioredoxin